MTDDETTAEIQWCAREAREVICASSWLPADVPTHARWEARRAEYVRRRDALVASIEATL